MKLIKIKTNKTKPLYPNIKDTKRKRYNRLLSQQEKEIFSKDALGFLLEVLHSEKINKEIFEATIEICFGYKNIFEKEIGVSMLKDILSSIVLQSNSKKFSLKDILNYLEKDNNLRVH